MTVDIIVEDNDLYAPDGGVPHHQTPDSVGFDLRANDTAIIEPEGHTLIPTGIRINMPTGMQGEVRSRSGLAYKKGVFVLNAPGTIDPDYTGDVGVILANFGLEDFEVERGDRIAQLVFTSYYVPRMNEVTEFRESSLRGEDGFGSTGIK